MLLTFNCPSLGSIRRRLIRNGDFLRDADARADVGAVVAARAIRKGTPMYLLVKKANVTDYPYSGMWALPGGMVRIQGAELDRDLLQRRASERTLSETNVFIPTESLRIPDGVPPATEYPVKGRLCTVIVVPFVFDLLLPDAAIQNMHSSHHSIDAVQVANPLPLMPAIAPANRVILSRLIWSELDTREQDSIRDTVSEAIGFSNAIAKRIGYPEIVSWF